MIVKFNSSGTHIHKNHLKIRLDFFPEVSDKTYVIHHVEMPIFPPGGYPGPVDAKGHPLDWDDYNNWVKSLPKAWQLNPCLCHFLKVDKDLTLAQLQAIIAQDFNLVTKQAMDNALSKDDTAGLRVIMGPKGGVGGEVTSITKKEIDELHTRLSPLEASINP